MCPNPGQTKPRSNIDLSIVERVFHEAKYLKLAQPIGFCGLGEPLQHPDRIDAFHIACESGIPWALGTNAQRLNTAVIDELMLTRPTQIVLSLDAMSQASMDQIRPGLTWERVYGNACRLIDMVHSTKLDAAGMAVWVQMIAFPANAHEWESFQNTFAEKLDGLEGSVVYLKRSCKMPGAEMPAHLYPTPSLVSARQREFQTSAKMLVDPDAEEWQLKSSVRPVCSLPLSYAMVRSDGNVIMCCMDSNDTTCIGNLNDESLIGLFHGPAAAKIRQALCYQEPPTQPSVPGLCKGCIVWEE